MAETIISLDYADSRLAFFEEQKKLHQQKLHWWKHQKPYKQYDAQTIHEKCSYHGEAICYFEDAINALKEPVRHGKWIKQGDEYIDAYYTCSECKADWFIPDGTPAENSMHYCPVCGAKMDLE